MRWLPHVLILTGVSLLAVVQAPWIPSTSERVPAQATSKTGDCGTVALALVCQADGKIRDLAELRPLTGTTSQGTTLLNLKTAATSLGYTATGVRLPFGDLYAHVNAPRHFAILHLRPNHFIAVLGTPPPPLRG